MGDEWIPYALTGVGVLLGLVQAGALLATATGSVSLTAEAVVTHLSGAPFVLLLASAAVWLPRSNVSSDRYRRMGKWTVAGLAFLSTVFGVIAFATQDGLMVRVVIVQWGSAVGGGVGLLMGTFEARAIERSLVTERVRIRNEELRRQNERLDELAGIISHDLRNPLNVANGYIEITKEDYGDDRLDTVASALDRMERIVEETLTLAKSGRVIDDPETVHLRAVAERNWHNVATNRAALKIDGSLAFQADPHRLQNLLENLFRNSVEHGTTDDRTDEGPGTEGAGAADPVVRVGTLPGGFYVEDDGPGVPEEKRESVFEAGHSTVEGGTGFGLAIVKQIAEAHGWRIDLVESDAGGARFEVTNVKRAPAAGVDPSGAAGKSTG